jgi:DNA-binding MarR family transcriptional regulator
MDNDSRITLGLLNAVDGSETITQRAVASDLGIALGLANAYLKRCVKKGYVKVRQVPRNRYAYYLTPRGFSEKSRLTAEYLSQSFSLFRQAREQYADLMAGCAARGWSTVALWGAGDLAEIALLYGTNAKIRIAGIVDDEADATPTPTSPSPPI